MKRIFAMIISAAIVCSAFAVTAYANDSEGGVPEGWIDEYDIQVDIPTEEKVDPNEPVDIMEEIPIEELESEVPAVTRPISENEADGGVPEAANPQTGNFSVAIVAVLAAMSAAGIAVKRK